MENTLKTANSHDVNWRKEMKTLLIKNGARIRPIIGSGRGTPSEVKQVLQELQAEVKAEMKEIAYAHEVANMPVTRIDEFTWKAGYEGHEHIVKKFVSDLDGKITYWCYDCPGFLNYKHCRHVDAVKFHEEHDGETKLEDF